MKPILLPMPPEMKAIILFLLMWAVICFMVFLGAICTGCASANYIETNDTLQTWRDSKDIPDSTKIKMLHVFGDN